MAWPTLSFCRVFFTFVRVSAEGRGQVRRDLERLDEDTFSRRDKPNARTIRVEFSWRQGTRRFPIVDGRQNEKIRTWCAAVCGTRRPLSVAGTRALSQILRSRTRRPPVTAPISARRLLFREGESRQERLYPYDGVVRAVTDHKHGRVLMPSCLQRS